MKSCGEIQPERVVEEWQPAIARVAASYVDASLRDDLTQELLISVWRALESFRGDCSLRTYIYRVAHNRAVDFVRRRARQPETEEFEHMKSGEPSAERVVSARRKRDRLLEAIRTLPLSYRQPLTLALDGLSYDEIADVLGLSTSNVGVRIHRARKKLESAMEDDDE